MKIVDIRFVDEIKDEKSRLTRNVPSLVKLSINDVLTLDSRIDLKGDSYNGFIQAPKAVTVKVKSVKRLNDGKGDYYEVELEVTSHV